MTLIDRYLLRRYAFACAVAFGAFWSLFTIVDLFANLDEFSKHGRTAGEILAEMGRHYLYRTSIVFDALGNLVPIAGLMLTLGLLVRHGELDALLSAGIPTRRLAMPLVAGVVAVNVLLSLNRELIIPQIAHELQIRPGQGNDTAEKIRPLQDFSTRLLVAGGQVLRRQRTLLNVEFVLPVPEMALAPTTLRAKSARYEAMDDRQGWRLQGVEPRADELQLTPRGEELLRPLDGGELFVATDLSYDEVVNRNKIQDYLSTRELLARVRNPTYGVMGLRNLSYHLHLRFVRPLLNVGIALMAIPLMLRRGHALLWNCGTTVLAAFLVLAQLHACEYLSQARLVRLDLAAWCPLITSGTAAAWFSGRIRT